MGSPQGVLQPVLFNFGGLERGVNSEVDGTNLPVVIKKTTVTEKLRWDLVKLSGQQNNTWSSVLSDACEGENSLRCTYTRLDTTLAVTTQGSDLGSSMDSSLKKVRSVLAAIKNVTRILGIIKRTIEEKPKIKKAENVIMLLYTFMVYPHLKYCE